MNPILTDYNKILEGCGKPFDEEYYSTLCDKNTLCPSCSKAKEVFLKRCQSELEFLENFFKNVGLIDYRREILEERISQLKEVLEKEK